NVARSQPADDRIAGPAPSRDAEQQIGLVGEPKMRSTDPSGLVGSGHDLLVGDFLGLGFLDRTKAPQPRTGGADVLARLLPKTRILACHQWAGCIATMRAEREWASRQCTVGRKRATARGLFSLRRVAGPVGLTLGDLLGQVNEHQLGPLIPQQ